MNIPNTMMRNANSRRGAMRSDGATGALNIAGGAVVAFAMGLLWVSVQVTSSRDASRETAGSITDMVYCGWVMVGESKSVSLSASAAPLVVSTVA